MISYTCRLIGLLSLKKNFLEAVIFQLTVIETETEIMNFRLTETETETEIISKTETETETEMKLPKLNRNRNENYFRTEIVQIRQYWLT